MSNFRQLSFWDDDPKYDKSLTKPAPIRIPIKASTPDDGALGDWIDGIERCILNLEEYGAHGVNRVVQDLREIRDALTSFLPG